MSGPNSGAEFLQQKYHLTKDAGVVATANKTGIPEHKYVDRIQAYLDRVARLINPPPLEGQPNSGGERAQRNIALLKGSLYDHIIIKPEEVPPAYFQSIIERHAEEGRPIPNIPDEIKKQLTDTLIQDQKESLDVWVDYLASPTNPSPDSPYPDWFKYYVLRSVLVMGRFEKDKGKFVERSKTGKSVGQFPELIEDALSFVYRAFDAKQKGGLDGLTYGYGVKDEERKDFKALMAGDNPNFSKIYAWALDKITPITEDRLRETKGNWVKYPKGSDPQKVADALAHYGTGWCIRGLSTAGDYLVRSDLEIYFSLDEKGEPTIPRIVIVTRNGKIDEVRGMAKGEHWDQYITDVVDQKLAQLPDGAGFRKRVADMQMMTAIHHKCFLVDKKTGARTYLSPTLTQEEARFLYEVDGEIEGFGYASKDPRIKEVLVRRNFKQDLPAILGCEPSQIARGVGEINENTKVHIGPLEPNVFGLCSKYKVEDIYTEFPGKKVKIESVTIGGKTKKELETLMDRAGVDMYSSTREMLNSKDFTTRKTPTPLRTVRLSVREFGFVSDFVTLANIYNRAKELGLELCPAEVGPQLMLQTDQSKYSKSFLGMEPIQVSNRYDERTTGKLFKVVRGAKELADVKAYPHMEVYGNDMFTFCLPQEKAPARSNGVNFTALKESLMLGISHLIKKK